MARIGEILTAEQMAEIYRQNVTLVRTRAAEIIPDANLTEDVVQDVFLAFVRFAKANVVEDVGTLLYLIATRAALRSRRKWLDRQRITPLDAKIPFLDMRLKAVEERVSFMKLIDSVREEEATIALAYFVEQMTQTEIANAMGQSQRDVSRTIERFLKRAQRRNADSVFEKRMASKGAHNG